MRKLVDQPNMPKDASSAWNPNDNFRLTTQARKPSNTATDRESMHLIACPKDKPSVSNSVESVAPKQGK